MSVSLQDRSDIEELYARYSVAFDVGDVDAWVDQFTEDAVLGDQIKGKPGIRGYIEGRLKERADDPQSDKVHLVFNLLLEYGDDDNHARGFCYLLRIGRSRDTGLLEMVQPGPICQFDEYHKQNGRWLFSVRGAMWELPESTSGIPGLGD